MNVLPAFDRDCIACRAVVALASVIAAGALAGGCARSAPPDPAQIARRAESLVPADPRLADLYLHACRACHVVASSGAPLTGDRAAWDERMKKGLPKLVDNAIAGLNGMPAGGQCVRCGVADYEALIHFMAGDAP